MTHFAGYQKPWDVIDCDFANYFWMYAKLSPYYPMILRNVTRSFAEEPAVNASSIENDPGIRRVANRLLPFGSRRREWVKKVYKTIRK